jgi:2-polyprenyl-3-methyl-5-hydroxy-6-metoxy-1,4-benzoquinol methylase
MAEQIQIDFSKLEGVTPITPAKEETTIPVETQTINNNQEQQIDFSKLEGVTPFQPKESIVDFNKLEGVTEIEEPIKVPTKLKEYTTAEKIRYGIDKQNTFFGNLYRVAKAGTQAAFDPDKDFEDYIKYNFEKEQLELKQRYGDLASGAYDDDTIVQGAAMATFLLDPFYIGAYMTPWGRAASASYKGISALSGVTVGLDTMLENLATTGKINPTEVGISAASAAALGPLTVKAFRGIQQLLPSAKTQDIQKIIGVIEGQKAKQLGITQTEFKKLQAIAGDKEILALNKELNLASKNYIKPIELATKKFNITEKSLETQIKNLKANIKDTKGKKFLYKNKYIENLNKIIDKKEKTLADSAAKFKAEQSKLWADISAKSKPITDLLAKRDYIYIKKIKEQQGLTRNMVEAVISASVRPALGAGVGYAFGKLWGGEDANLNNWMMSGAALGGLNKLIQRSGKVFSTGEKNFLEGVIFNNATRTIFQKARELTATTTLTKLKAFGGGSEKIGMKLFQEIDSPVSKFSSAAISDNLKQKYSLEISKLIRNTNEAEQEAAIRIVRGSKEKASSKVNNLADGIKNFLNNFQKEYNSVGIGLRKPKLDKNGNVVYDKKNNPVTVRIENIQDYFPRVWKWDVIKKDPEKFKKVLADIFKSQGHKEPQAKANSFYSSLETSNERGFYDKSAITELVNNIIGKSKEAFTKPIIKNLPLSDHITKDRVLTGSYSKVEKILEQNDFLVNEVDSVLNKLITTSVDSIAFAKNFGDKGQLLKPFIEEIVNKYAGNTNAAALASYEIGLVMKNIDAFLGRYGQVRQGIVRTGTGILSTISNLNMLDRVTIASLGDLVQPFQNSTNFRSWIQGLSRTALTQKGESGLAKQMGFAQSKETQQSLLKTLTPLDDATNTAKVMGSPGNVRKLNELGFKVMGLQWLTGFARRYAYNTGTIDAFVSAKKLANYVGRGNSLNTSKGIKLVENVSKYGINTSNALRLGKFKNFDDAISKKFAREILNDAGIVASNRDALIPQVSNRLLFTQSRDPLVRLLGQFMSWTLAKSAQTNRILQRIENGDVKQLVKLLAGLPVYGGIQSLREIAKYGEVQTDLETQTDKWYSEALRLSGISGTAPELIIGRLSGPGAREPWYLFAPFFSILTDTGDVAKETYKGNTDKATQIFMERLAPLPTWRRWVMKLFPDADFVTDIPNSTVNQKIGFNIGGVVGKAIAKAAVKRGDTAISTTIGTYKKVNKIFDDNKVKSVHDFGSGLGLGSKQFTNKNVTSHEPFVPLEKIIKSKGKVPDYKQFDDVLLKEGFASKDGVVNLNVLNVIEDPIERANVVKNIAQLINKDGMAVITTRGSEVASQAAKSKNATPFGDGFLFGKGDKKTFQKGFAQKELEEFVKNTLGGGFTVSKIPNKYKIGTSGVIITKNKPQFSEGDEVIVPKPKPYDITAFVKRIRSYVKAGTISKEYGQTLIDEKLEEKGKTYKDVDTSQFVKGGEDIGEKVNITKGD